MLYKYTPLMNNLYGVHVVKSVVKKTSPTFLRFCHARPWISCPTEIRARPDWLDARQFSMGKNNPKLRSLSFFLSFCLSFLRFSFSFLFSNSVKKPNFFHALIGWISFREFSQFWHFSKVIWGHWFQIWP